MGGRRLHHKDVSRFGEGSVLVMVGVVVDVGGSVLRVFL